MIRIVLTYIVPFFLPMVVYFLWATYRARYVEEHSGEAPAIEKGPWPLLIFLGAILAFGTMAVSGLMRGGNAGATYTPSYIENGKIVPGRLENKQP